MRKNYISTVRLHGTAKLLPLFLALLCPSATFADDDGAVRASVCEGATVKETAQFQLSKTPRFSFDSEGKLVMKLGDSNTNIAVLPIKNNAEMHITMGNYDETQNKKNVTVSAAGYGTLYSAFQMVVPEGVEVFAPVYNEERQTLSINESTLVEEGTILPAGTGVVLKNQGSYDFAYSAEEPDAVTTSLTGSAVATPVSDYDGTVYSLAKEDGEVAFYRYTPSMTVGGKAFLVLDNNVDAHKITFVFDDESETTVVESATIESRNDDRMYNIAGQRVGNGYRGIVIQNGRKFKK